jgi:hypothetical protein
MVYSDKGMKEDKVSDQGESMAKFLKEGICGIVKYVYRRI